MDMKYGLTEKQYDEMAKILNEIANNHYWVNNHISKIVEVIKKGGESND